MDPGACAMALVLGALRSAAGEGGAGDGEVSTDWIG
jgi:hypothetical protein